MKENDSFKLDLRDKKLLFELDKNSRASLSDLSKKLKTSKEVVHYRLKKLIDEKVILMFHTITSLYRFGFTAYKVYLRLSNCSKEDLDKLINYLLANKEINWFGTCNGRWDLVFGTTSRTLEEFMVIQDKVMHKFGRFIQEKGLSISRENLQYNRRWMYQDDSPVVEFNFGERESKIDLDEKDKKILNAISTQSRKTLVEIAQETKLSVDVVRYRIKSMEKEGMIRGYKCLLNPHKLGFVTCKAFVFFKNITEEKKREFINYVKNMKNTINIITTFAAWDLEIMFETKSYEDYFTIMEEVKEKFKEIIRFYESLLVTSEPKQLFLVEN